MKKILALVLALVMTMSLATISSGAAYSDADSVQYVDAVNTMSALGVLGGYADGSIRPQADVTRGAAAKMVAMVATGSNTTTIGYYKGTSSFADVPATHTFADAVAFCVARGIVAGYGDGNYGVADNVKGWAVAKMVLVAMGYDAKAFGMEGAGSALNTITLASQKGLFAGMAADFNANEAASREECAQIVYNALNVVGVVKGAVNSDGSYTYTTDGAKALAANYSAIKYGVVTANAATGSTKGLTELDGGSVKLTNETGLDMIGHKIMYVDSKAYSADGVVAFAPVDVSYAVEVSKAIAAEKDFHAAFGTAAISTASVTKFANYAVDGTAAAGFDSATHKANAGTFVLYTDATGATSLVSYLKPSTYEIGSVKAYTAGTAAKNGSVEFNSISANSGKWNLYTKTGETNVTAISLYDGIAVNDAVAIQKTGNLYTATKLETVTGKVTAIDKTTGAQSLTIGGKVYSVNTTLFTATNSDVGTTQTAYAWASSMNKDVVAYLDLSGAVVALVQPVAATTDAGVVYVTATYKVEGAANAYGEAGYDSYYVQAVGLDGKEVTFLTAGCQADHTSNSGVCDCTAATLYGGASVKSIQKVSMVYDDVLKTDVATFDTAAVADTVAVTTPTISADVAATALKIADGYYYASGVKFIYVDGAKSTLKVEVKDGVQKVAKNAVVDVYSTKAATDANYNVQYVFVEGKFAAENVKSTDVVYVSALFDTDSVKDGVQTDKTESYTNAAGKDAIAYVYDVYVNGEAKSIKTSADALTAGFNTYEINADGMYVLKAMDSSATKIVGEKVDNLYGTLLTIDGTAVIDAEAASAKIVDVYYAANSYANPDLVETTSLSGLFGSAAAKNAVVDVYYTVDAANVVTVAAIYVTTQAVVD